MRIIALTLLFIISGLVSASEELKLHLNGRMAQGGLVVGKTLPGSSVTHDGESVMVSKDGDFLIGFEREAPADSRLEVMLPDGELLVRKMSIEPREYDIQKIDGLPKRKVTPSPEDAARIKKDRQDAKAARALRSERTDYLSGFDWPATGRITGVYGSQRILNGKPKWPHYGVDVAGPVGAPVAAPAPGLVTLAHPDMFYSGGTLILDHGQGLSSTFLHLSKIVVKEGERVEKGDKIAEIGATGRVTGPHLDWRMNLGKKRVDPQTIVAPMPVVEGKK